MKINHKGVVVHIINDYSSEDLEGTELERLLSKYLSEDCLTTKGKVEAFHFKYNKNTEESELKLVLYFSHKEEWKYFDTVRFSSTKSIDDIFKSFDTTKEKPSELLEREILLYIIDKGKQEDIFGFSVS